MSFPNFKNKYQKPAVFTPSDFMAYKKEAGRYPEYKSPEGIIFGYDRRLMELIVTAHKVIKVDGFFGDLYLLDETDGKIAVVGNFGIGAPTVVTLLEELIAFGVKKFISIGTAGTLQRHIKIGSIMVCEKAIRDEGTSYHYLKPSKHAYASPIMTNKIKESLEKFQQEYFVGTSWTIDAPYRETIAEVKRYQKEGVSAVEMEAAALFAVAQYRNVEMGAIFTISDSLGELKWKPKFHSSRTKQGLEVLYKVALDALTQN